MALLVLVLWQAVSPVQHLMSSRYTTKGSEQLAALKFTDASATFTRALNLNPENHDAKSQLELAKAGETDIAELRSYLVSHNRDDVVAKIDASTENFATPKEAVATGISYFLAGEYVYARYPFEKALSLDGNYPEALHYLALTYDKLAEFDASYREKAAELRVKRDSLTPRWIGS